MLKPLVVVIGAGAIGAPIAQRILDAGFALTVCDRNEETLAAFAERGAQVARQPRECAAADVVVILVATADQVREVVFGAGGIAAGLRAGVSPLVVVMSTMGPDAVCELGHRLEALGVRLIDAPVSGGTLRAEQGKLTIMAGGDAADVEAARPVFDSFADRLFHCGPVGAAQRVKIINNIVAASNVLVTAEAYRLALDQGIALHDVTSVLEASSGRNHLSQHAGEAAASFARWTRSRQDFDALVAILRKDLHVAQQMASASAATFPFLQALTTTMDSLGEESFETWRVVAGRAADRCEHAPASAPLSRAPASSGPLPSRP